MWRWVCILVFMVFFLLSMQFTGHARSGVDAAELTVGFLTGAGGLGDESFNDITYGGIARARRELGFRFVYREWEPRRETPEEALDNLLKKKPDIIVFNGAQYHALVINNAPLYPGIRMIINDSSIDGIPNVRAIEYGQHEGAYLAGVLAGHMTRSGKIGFVGGLNIPVVHSFRVGFVEGVSRSNPSASVMVSFLSRGEDYTGFNNPEKGCLVGRSLYDRGADIIFTVAGSSGNGVILAAAERKKYVIGADSDQDHMAKGYVLTSVLKRMDEAVFRELVKTVRGTMVPGTVYYGLKEGGVSLSPMTYTKHKIPEHVLRDLARVREGIISGRIRITNILGIGRLKGESP